MFLWLLAPPPRLFWAEFFVADGVKPPWNQPQVTPFSFIRLPMFFPVSETVTPVGRPSAPSALPALLHWSKYGSPSPCRTPLTTEELVPPCVSAPSVSPLTRLIAPGDDGPNWLS